MDGNLQRAERPVPLHTAPDHQGHPPHVAELMAKQLKGANAALRELLLALSVGFALPGPLPADLQHKFMSGTVEDLDSLVDRAEAAGLLTPDGTVVGTAQHALLSAAPTAKVHALQRELVTVFASAGQPLGNLARELARGGLADPRVAAELEQAADALLETDPRLASQLYEEALLAGSDPLALAARRAQAAAGDGELDAAARIIDALLVSPAPPDVRRGADVAAAVWAQRGMLARGADVYSWLGPGRVGPSAPLAAVAMIGAGDRAAAEAFFQPEAPAASPTLLAAALVQTGQGILASLGDKPHQGIPILIHASDMLNSAGTALPLPETPAALAALLALHSGEPHLAETVCRAAAAAGQGGHTAQPRLLLLQAWAAMMQDKLEDARLAATEAAKANHWPLVPRDEFMSAALEVGLARRNGDVPELIKAWERAREAMLHTSVDLYNLLPWGELLIAAARLRETRRVAQYLEDAWKLLGRLGGPALWAVPLHWSAVQAALLSESPADLAPHATALARASAHSQLAAVLATAGKAWVSVLAGRFRTAEVEGAARLLGAVGMPWEGARLAGHAAARAEERRDMMRLLSCARDLHPQGSPAGGASGAAEVQAGNGADKGAKGAQPDASGLSEREKEVARLVLEGKTYREIGEAIYISPRTAEHHIARIRRRLGAENRSDLLARLRLSLGVEHPQQLNPQQE
ncbi:LuxR C-terminal-related transcriptional regulator [Pseudarthrobacter sp. NIBRBAC000502770]|uniref:LuxR C-terminal-related transcriptional regulator n=1 Tax=Pseudarthrobacter sp. NIBRBAC000502770 TaxID=2590785 RepID=UPI00113FCB3E|nr:LuxR C-terminal-related transcriptional regulator [Pseudarthrobacter sp. NIBRBAC000502770]QDG89545.1 helix-turn-helix transcriptional regulator [Pseudarthrobacter sp. NIBRBAC000502770]